MLADRTWPSPPIRWTGALAIVLALHATAAWLLLTHAVAPISVAAAPEAIMLELAPDLPALQPAAAVPPAPVPPPVEPATVPEPPPLPEPMEPDLPPVALPPTPPVAAAVMLPVPPPRPQPMTKPKPKPRAMARPRPVEQTRMPLQTDPIQPSAPSIAPAPAQPAPLQRSALPAAPASTVPSSWRSDLLGRLQRAKRYPDLARSRGDQGVATVRFTLNRDGRVLDVTLLRSSNSSLLDDEAVALVRRAEPLPPMTSEMEGNSISLTVPISFALR